MNFVLWWTPHPFNPLPHTRFVSVPCQGCVSSLILFWVALHQWSQHDVVVPTVNYNELIIQMILYRIQPTVHWDSVQLQTWLGNLNIWCYALTSACLWEIFAEVFCRSHNQRSRLQILERLPVMVRACPCTDHWCLHSAQFWRNNQKFQKREAFLLVEWWAVFGASPVEKSQYNCNPDHMRRHVHVAAAKVNFMSALPVRG